jgi:antitoxin CptB
VSEAADTRLRRLAMRSSRRGLREADLILGAFARARLGALGPAELDLYERLLEENDQDLLGWLTGREAAPADFAALVARIADEAPGLLGGAGPA